MLTSKWINCGGQVSKLHTQKSAEFWITWCLLKSWLQWKSKQLDYENHAHFTKVVLQQNLILTSSWCHTLSVCVTSSRVTSSVVWNFVWDLLLQAEPRTTPVSCRVGNHRMASKRVLFSSTSVSFCSVFFLVDLLEKRSCVCHGCQIFPLLACTLFHWCFFAVWA